LEPLTTGNNEHYLYFEDIKATEFNEPITAVIKDKDGKVVSRTLTYSINTYIYKNQSVGGKIEPMVQAIYNYGNSAVNYNGN